MGKVFKVVATVAAIAVAFVPGVGPALSGALVSIGGGTFAAAGIAATIVSGVATFGVMSALGIASKALGLGPSPPKASPANTDRLRASIDVRAPRKIVFGNTAMALDVHYQEFTGTDQEYLNNVPVFASHTVQSIDEIWFDQDKAWSASNGVASKFAGYLTVTTRTAGTAANAFTITGSSSWVASSCRLTGCAYGWLRYKLTGNGKKAESPFSSSVTSRITVRGRGALLYDPRLDSTNGGSGSHRPDNQATWAWVNDNVGRNPALQLLWYLLGWKINGTLAVGLGLPPARIDLASFITAANICDEAVSLAAGGVEARYRSDGVFSEADDPQLVFENLLATMNGVLRDAGGKIALELLVNDLAAPVADFYDDDVIGDFVWVQTPPVNETFNVVRGRYVDASDNSLYQMVDYPDVALGSLDGIDRSTTYDLPTVQSASQAQRLAKQFLQRAQYPGTFAADFLASAWRVRVGSIVRLTFSPLGFSTKLFRVVEHTIRPDGVCPMVLREENSAIYAWAASESPAVQAATPISYNPVNNPLIRGIGEIPESLLGPNANRVPLSKFEKINPPWILYNPNGIAGTPFTALGNGRAYFKANFTATASGQVFALYNGETYAPFPVTPGERLSCQIGIEASGPIAHTDCSVDFYDLSGTYLSSIAVGSLVGAQSYNTKLRNFGTVPPNAVKARITVYFTTSGAGAGFGVIVEPMVTQASPDQVIHPAFSPGPNAIDAADVTAANVAAGITGQGYFATQDYVDWLSRITGTGKPESYATRNQDGANMLEDPLKMSTYAVGQAVVTREDFGGANGAGIPRDNYRIRLDSNDAWAAVQGKLIPVVPGETLFFSCLIYRPGAAGSCITVMNAHCFDGRGEIGYTGAVGGVVVANPPADTWNFYQVKVTVPYNCSYIRPYFQRYGGASVSNIYFTEPYIGRAQKGADVTIGNVAAAILNQGSFATASQITNPGQLVDGVVVTDKIVNDGISGGGGGATSAGTLIGNGTNQDAVVYTFGLDKPARCIFAYSIAQGYTSGNPSWNGSIEIDGVSITGRGGTEKNDAPMMSAYADLAAGAHTLKGIWYGASSGIRCTPGTNIFVLPLKR